MRSTYTTDRDDLSTLGILPDVTSRGPNLGERLGERIPISALFIGVLGYMFLASQAEYAGPIPVTRSKHKQELPK